MSEVTIRYQVITRRRSGPATIETREKTFASEGKMERWISKEEAKAEEERGGFVGVLAYSFNR